MAISDKEAFRILDLPLGVDKDAINQRYKTLSSKLASSKLVEDLKKLEKVVQAFHQLIPPNKNRQNNLSLAGRSNHRANDDAANLSAVIALQRKAEKKKEKKKRKKEKRKNNDKSEKFISNTNGKIREESDCSSCEGEDESSDMTNSFNYPFGQKSNYNQNNDTNGSTAKKSAVFDNSSLDPEIQRNRQLQARSMAVQGNDAAAQGQHQKAVKLFTQAVTYDPNDHRFLGNRSFCFEQLKQFDKALCDADKAIELSIEWPKGHFRRGRALLGLTQYTDAEEAFSRVLQLDPECQEAQEEIINVRRYRLMEMGFTQEQALQAIAKYKQVQSALDALLSGEFHDATANLFPSDASEEDFETHTEARVVIPASSLTTKKPSPHAEDIKMNSRNPHGLTSLWVGNVLPEVSEKELQKLFSKYGHVSSVRQLKEKFCAFVNFTDSNSAGRAMDKLQGYLVNGQRLLIKFPDNPINCTTIGVGSRRRPGTSSASNNTSKISPSSAVNDSPKSNGSVESTDNNSISSSNADDKLKGPVYGDECYFWRTTGCMFLETCRHKHLLKSKGIDRKPWQK